MSLLWGGPRGERRKPRNKRGLLLLRKRGDESVDGRENPLAGATLERRRKKKIFGSFPHNSRNTTRAMSLEVRYSGKKHPASAQS